MANDIERSEQRPADRVTARDATGAEAPVRASDQSTVTIDRESVSPASPGATEDEAAAAEQAASQES